MTRIPGLSLALLLSVVTGAFAQSAGASVERLYADVKAKEKAVRTALADPAVSSSVLKAVRTVVADYEGLVRQFPASAYTDDALWFAGWLSIDAFGRFGGDAERDAGTRLWRALAAQFPSSKLAKQVPRQLAAVEAMGGSPGADSARPASGDAAPARPASGNAAPARPASGDAAPARPASGNAAPATAPAPSRIEPPRAPAAPARRPAGLATLKDIRRTVLPDAVRVTIELDREVSFRDERLADPARVFVDLSATRPSAELTDRTIRFERDADLVRQVRIGRHPNSTTRVVLDLAGITSYSVYPLYGPYRLVIDCIRADAEPAAALPWVAPAPRPLAGRPLAPPFARALPVPDATLAPPEPPPLAPLAAVPLSAPIESAPRRESAPAAATAGPVTPPSRNVGGGFSIARQLGLGVSRIVVDPGHGGHDPGATGKGVTEAAIVLDVALRLENLLAKVPGVEVILTRRTDEFVALQERTAIANREGADLFLSIHANASANLQAKGIETYFLNFATTSSAAAVAARENAASGQPMAALPDLVKTIALHNKLDESRDFATHVQRAMIARLKGANRSVKDLGVKQAPFVVLIGASMPSVLAEVSFVTNAQEVRLLRGPAYRQRIADALFDAIRRYQGALKTDAKSTQ